jgi:hypothetical protein
LQRDWGRLRATATIGLLIEKVKGAYESVRVYKEGACGIRGEEEERSTKAQKLSGTETAQ